MAEIKLYKTTKRGLKVIGMSIPFVVIGVWMITQEPFGTFNYIMGWLCTCFFGLGIPVGLFQTFDKRPQIIINENGVWDRTTKQDEIKWEQIIEAYPLDIHEQKFICLVTDDTFVFKKKPYKWATKINEFVGAQNLNLSLGQINVDEVDLTNLINELSKVGTEERGKLIQSFKVNRSNFSISDLQKALLYIFTSLSLLLFTLTGIAAFMTVMVVFGVAAVIARWRPDNLKLRKYAGTVVWLGIVNMVLYVGTITIHDNITEDVGEQLAIEIEDYYEQHAKFPTDIKSITQKLDLNILERYFADKIEYRTIDTDYELEVDMIFGKRRKYDKNESEWR